MASHIIALFLIISAYLVTVHVLKILAKSVGIQLSVEEPEHAIHNSGPGREILRPGQEFIQDAAIRERVGNEAISTISK